MKIGIIGSGNIGGALTHHFRDVGHDVSVANSRGPTSLADLAKETGAKAVTVEQAARENEIVVIAIPMKAVESLPHDLFARAHPGVIVVDTSNYYPRQRDGKIAGIEDGTTESAWVEKRVGHPVIKAFNTIYAEHLLRNGKPAGTPGRIALAIAGDDAEAKSAVMDLVDQIGFDTVDDGTIADSWRQQPGTPGYAKDFDAAGVRRALDEAKQERTPDWCATPNSPGTYETLPPKPR